MKSNNVVKNSEILNKNKMQINNKSINFCHLKQKLIFGLLSSTLALSVGILVLIIYFVFSKGISVINLGFIFKMPKNGMDEGGIFPALLGLFYLIIGFISFATSLRVLFAIYMTEYAEEGEKIRIIRIGVNNLAGVPSVVFGLLV
ncbi:ABC-type phosphate transport system permease subunit [Sporohalobacter salinus]|nr:hypothetical protein [Sporohalobacter salinus]MBM7623875.1 ABC-type phosphate transport system permease subunit [Sporohalobacter salinus]